MSGLTTYAVQRGEDATFVLYAPLATDLTGWGATAKLRKLAVGAHRLDPSAAVAATYGCLIGLLNHFRETDSLFLLKRG